METFHESCPIKLWSWEDFCESSSCGSEGNPKYIALFKVQSHSSTGQCSSWVPAVATMCRRTAGYSKSHLKILSNKVQPAMELPQQLHKTAKSFSCDPTNCSVNHLRRVSSSMHWSMKNPKQQTWNPKEHHISGPWVFSAQLWTNGTLFSKQPEGQSCLLYEYKVINFVRTLKDIKVFVLVPDFTSVYNDQK